MAREKRINMVILGLLSHEDLTGYDMKKRIDNSISFFWNGSFGNIYPALKELEDESLIKSSNAAVGGREKIIYHITAKGKRVLKEWLKDEQASNELRYETLLKLFFGHEAGAEQTLAHLEAFEEKISKELPFLIGATEVLKKGISEDDTHKYYLLTAEFGVKTYQAYLEWCREAKVMLKEERG